MRPSRKILLSSVLLVPLLLGGTKALGESEQSAPVVFVTAESVLKLQDAGRPLLIVDVRTRQEFEASHIRGAVSIPLAELFGRNQEVPRQGLVVLY